MKKETKDFDAVRMMREIRERIAQDTAGMNFAQLRQYINDKLRESGHLLPESIRPSSAQ